MCFFFLCTIYFSFRFTFCVYNKMQSNTNQLLFLSFYVAVKDAKEGCFAQVNPTDCESNHYNPNITIAIAKQRNSLIHTDMQSCSLQLLSTRHLSHNHVVSSGVPCCYCKSAHACQELYCLQTYPANMRSLIYLPLNLRYGGCTVSWLHVPNKHLTAPLTSSESLHQLKKTEPSSKKMFISLPHEDCHSDQVAIKTELWQSLTRTKVVPECNM